MRKKLSEITVGDKVVRMLAGIVPDEVKVTEADERFIHCGPWKFLRETGGEVDEDLGWDGRRTGSYIVAADV